MAKDVVAPRFGERLKHERHRRKWSFGQVVSRVHRTSTVLDGFASSQLLHYEAGHVAMPDPVALGALATVYGLDLGELVKALAEDRGAAQESPPLDRTPAVKGRRASSR